MYSCLFSKLFAFIAVLLVGPCSAVRFENDPAALETASATGISYANSLVRRSLGVLNETISSVIESHSMNLPSTTMSLTRCKESLQNVHVYLNATEKNIYINGSYHHHGVQGPHFLRLMLQKGLMQFRKLRFPGLLLFEL